MILDLFLIFLKRKEDSKIKQILSQRLYFNSNAVQGITNHMTLGVEIRV